VANANHARLISSGHRRGDRDVDHQIGDEARGSRCKRRHDHAPRCNAWADFACVQHRQFVRVGRIPDRWLGPDRWSRRESVTDSISSGIEHSIPAHDNYIN
jgi:hypothetical protein